MEFDNSCIFCKIIQQQAPASVIYEDKAVICFLDIRPLVRGHSLVIPKTHFVDIFDIPPKSLMDVYSVTKQVSRAVKVATNADGVSIIQQNGKAAGQEIFHFHVHVVPRFTGEKLSSFSDLKAADRAQLDEMAQEIIQHI